MHPPAALAKDLEDLRCDLSELAEMLHSRQTVRALEDLLTGAGYLHISQVNGEVCVSTDTGRAVRGTVKEALAAMIGQEAAKQCLKCWKEKPLSCFAISRRAPDGRWRYCLTCERVRVRRYAAKKKRRDARAKSAGTAPIAPDRLTPSPN